MTLALFVACLALAGFRVAGEAGIVFQAVAHCFIGALFADCCHRRERRRLAMLAFLCVVETACFAATHRELFEAFRSK